MLWDFELETDRSTPAWRVDLVIINEKITFYLVDFVGLADHIRKLKEKKRIMNYSDPARGLKK